MDEPTPEELRAALLERCMAAYAKVLEEQPSVHFPDPAGQIGAVLDLLASEGRLIDPGDLQGSVGVVVGQLRDTRRDLAAALGEVERLEARLEARELVLTRERDMARADLGEAVARAVYAEAACDRVLTGDPLAAPRGVASVLAVVGGLILVAALVVMVVGVLS